MPIHIHRFTMIGYDVETSSTFENFVVVRNHLLIHIKLNCT